jgi:hypothetical protein
MPPAYVRDASAQILELDASFFSSDIAAEMEDSLANSVRRHDATHRQQKVSVKAIERPCDASLVVFHNPVCYLRC